MKQFLAIALLCSASLFAADFSIGIRIGPPPQPRYVRVQPRSPGQGYVFVEGYWYPVGNRYRWHNGYWTRPPYAGANWIAPRHDGQQYYGGHWGGERGDYEHDHRWDKQKGRDFDRRHEDRR